MKLDKDNKCNINTLVKVSYFFTLLSTLQFVSVLTRNVLDVALTQLLESKRIDIRNELHVIESLKILVKKTGG